MELCSPALGRQPTGCLLAGFAVGFGSGCGGRPPTGLSKASKGSLQELCRLLAVNTEGSKLILAERALGAIPALRADIERAQQSLRGQVDGRKNGVKA